MQVWDYDHVLAFGRVIGPQKDVSIFHICTCQLGVLFLAEESGGSARSWSDNTLNTKLNCRCVPLTADLFLAIARSTVIVPHSERSLASFLLHNHWPAVHPSVCRLLGSQVCLYPFCLPPLIRNQAGLSALICAATLATARGLQSHTHARVCAHAGRASIALHPELSLHHFVRTGCKLFYGHSHHTEAPGQHGLGA